MGCRYSFGNSVCICMEDVVEERQCHKIASAPAGVLEILVVKRHLPVLLIHVQHYHAAVHDLDSELLGHPLVGIGPR